MLATFCCCSRSLTSRRASRACKQAALSVMNTVCTASTVFVRQVVSTISPCLHGPQGDWCPALACMGIRVAGDWMPKKSLHQARLVQCGLVGTHRQARCLHGHHSACKLEALALTGKHVACMVISVAADGKPLQHWFTLRGKQMLTCAAFNVATDWMALANASKLSGFGSAVSSPSAAPFMIPVLTPMIAIAAPWAVAGSSLAAGCSDLKGVLGAMAGGVAGVATSSCTGASACEHSGAVSQGPLAGRGKGC